ncbi:DUF3422 family protein [Spongiibacter marinus]|uniref:DUF3422 family protein n=1 Tax=Spongiibacter marinus TaxID=354246 RepID=UPI001EF8F8EC|nr:DUF3422 family protein [Spongiibacter marinus]MBM7425037.1 putative membrane-anchored protein [Spongiibacter marinus]
MKEPANINTTTVQPTPTATVYGMPAYADRAAAVGEVHARPHLLLEAPRGILQLAFMTEGDQTRDQMAMSELSHLHLDRNIGNRYTGLIQRLIKRS